MQIITANNITKEALAPLWADLSLTRRQIAAKFGKSCATTISKAAKRHQLPPRKNGRRKGT